MMKSAIQVCRLKKSYDNNIVLGGLNFEIKKGETFALLGVNGAGKTTALECIEGLRKYDSGAITVNGKRGIQLQSSSLPAHIKKSTSKIGGKGYLRPKNRKCSKEKTSSAKESMMKSTEFCGRCFFGGSDLKNVIIRQPHTDGNN